MNNSMDGSRASLLPIRYSRLIAGVLLPMYLASCTSWKVQSTSPEQVVSESSSSTLRVTLTNGYQVDMQRARVTEDSLYGYVNSSSAEQGVALADISQISKKKTSVGRTVGLVVVVYAVLAVIASLAVGDSFFEDSGGFLAY